MATTIGLLAVRSPRRTLAWLFWQVWSDEQRKPVLDRAARRVRGSHGRCFPRPTSRQTASRSCGNISAAICRSNVRPLRSALTRLFAEAGEYLFYVLAGDETFAISGDAERILVGSSAARREQRVSETVRRARWASWMVN